jgi:putative phage-type endonuclease
MDRSRMHGIGASDVPTILGLNPFQTPLELFNRLTGVSEPVEQSEPMYWGHKHEVSIAERFAEDHNVKLMAYKKRYFSKKLPFFSCELDRIIVGTDTSVECKSVGAYRSKDWSGDDNNMPAYVIAQVIAQLGLSDRSESWVACLIGGNDYREKLVKFDPDFFKMIEEKVATFWGMVESNTPPMAILGDDDALLALHPKNNDQMAVVEYMNEAIAQRQSLAGQIEAMKEEKELLEVKIKECIGDNLGIKTSAYTCTWKEQGRKSIDTDALKLDGLYDVYSRETKTRVLRVAAVKEGKK